MMINLYNDDKHLEGFKQNLKVISKMARLPLKYIFSISNINISCFALYLLWRI